MTAMNFIAGIILCGTHFFVSFGFYLQVLVSPSYEEVVEHAAGNVSTDAPTLA